ncbi:MAG TPA: hypothetical protein VE871_01315 [Longimicrobium sp.]|nr:hypothetical protein [Longimicrobium sp.]
MKSTFSVLRSLVLLGAVALSAPLLAPQPAAAEDGCIMQGFEDGSYCIGCRSGNCSGAACYDASSGETYERFGCTPQPIFA